MSAKANEIETPLSDIDIVQALEVSHDLDASGLRCPLPLLKAKQALHRLKVGDTLRVVATDGGSERDFHTFASLSGHAIVYFAKSNGNYYYVLEKN